MAIADRFFDVITDKPESFSPQQPLAYPEKPDLIILDLGFQYPVREE